ncbi:TonB family protein [Sorangium sp. So ce291]|uniref:TonB family protein n=1 Tax=Sorangium sp. So ce291 TaxID=3133294 RepID=UPI003F63D466
MLGAALLLTGARVAWAEEAQRPALAVAPAVTPPRPLAPPDVGYPEDARGDAVVLLVITVSADGTVRSASASEGPEPFASAAIAAASAFRFAPATRDGAPIASKIRLEIRFTAPASLPPAPAPGAAEPPPPQVAPGAAPRPAPERPTTVAPLEVTVRGEAKAPPVAGFSRAEVRLIPGAFGDPFRAVEALPGVTPLFSGAPYFYVRGAPPGNVGYFLDGVRVPLLYHIGFGPSVVNPALVQRVDLYPGGYPARYGRHTGGIVAGETRPPLPEAHGEGALRLVDAGALVEAPFAGGRSPRASSSRPVSASTSCAPRAQRGWRSSRASRPGSRSPPASASSTRTASHHSHRASSRRCPASGPPSTRVSSGACSRAAGSRSTCPRTWRPSSRSFVTPSST